MRKYKGPKLDILIDQGTCDEFLERELLPDHFVRACADVTMPLNLRLQKVPYSLMLEQHTKAVPQNRIPLAYLMILFYHNVGDLCLLHFIHCRKYLNSLTSGHFLAQDLRSREHPVL